MQSYIERAERFVRGLSREALITWFTEYPTGRTALELLALELLAQDEKRKGVHATEQQRSIYAH
jgi:hypothetical protein